MAVSSAGFPQAIRVLRYSGTVTRKMHSFRLQDYYLLGSRFPANSAKNAFCNFPLVNKDRRYRPTTPSLLAILVTIRRQTQTGRGLSQKFCDSPRIVRITSAFVPNTVRNDGLGFSRFARRYSGNTSLFFFLLVLRCFTSQGTLLLFL